MTLLGACPFSEVPGKLSYKELKRQMEESGNMPQVNVQEIKTAL